MLYLESPTNFYAIEPSFCPPVVFGLIINTTSSRNPCQSTSPSCAMGSSPSYSFHPRKDKPEPNSFFIPLVKPGARVLVRSAKSTSLIAIDNPTQVDLQVWSKTVTAISVMARASPQIPDQYYQL